MTTYRKELTLDLSLGVSVIESKTNNNYCETVCVDVIMPTKSHTFDNSTLSSPVLSQYDSRHEATYCTVLRRLVFKLFAIELVMIIVHNHRAQYIYIEFNDLRICSNHWVTYTWWNPTTMHFRLCIYEPDSRRLFGDWLQINADIILYWFSTVIKLIYIIYIYIYIYNLYNLTKYFSSKYNPTCAGSKCGCMREKWPIAWNIEDRERRDLLSNASPRVHSTRRRAYESTPCRRPRRRNCAAADQQTSARRPYRRRRCAGVSRRRGLHGFLLPNRHDTYQLSVHSCQC